LLLRAEKIIGGEIWLVEEAVWEAIKNLGAQVSDEEKEYFPQLVAGHLTHQQIKTRYRS